MNIRYFTIIILLLSVLSASADKKMTIRNYDTGESFEVSVPDGMRIYEYNSNWLDSIPYLLERARYGEPWAYEALGDCYRYGKGGVDRSMFKALAYYSLSGKDIEEIAKESIKENPIDHLGLIFKLIDKLECNDNNGTLVLLDTLKQEQYADADILRDYINETDTLLLADTVERHIMSPEISTDKMMFAIIGCVYRNWMPDSLRHKDGMLTAMGVKFPYIYDKIAVKFLRENHEDMDSVKLAEKKTKAITFLELADKEAMLSREGAENLYRHYNSEIEAGRMVPDTDNMERLATVARLPESEIFIFTDK